jgi:hypothetical protein
MLEADTQVRQLKEFLEPLEQAANTYRPPYAYRNGSATTSQAPISQHPINT